MIPENLRKEKGVKILLPAHGRAGQRQLHNSFAAYFAKRNPNLGGGESEGEAGIHFPHTPFSARLARANWFLAREARHQFRSKKVRAFSNNGHHLKNFSPPG
jgi:hypothetical protein